MRSENKNFLFNVVYQGLTLVFPLVTFSGAVKEITRTN